MNLTHQQYELIEAYLNGELSEIDQTTFEIDLSRDAELRAEVETQRELRLGFQALAIEKQLILARQRWQQTNQSEQTVTDQQIPFGQTINTRRWGRLSVWSAAASVVLVLGFSVWVYLQNNQQSATDIAFNEAYKPDDSQVLTKDFPITLPATDQANLQVILNQYKAGKYADVIKQLETLPTEKQTVPYKNYFLGLSLLANKQPDKAIPYLQTALSDSKGKLAQKSEWFLALAYLKTGDKTEAGKRLSVIAANPNHPFQALARQVMGKL